MERRLELTVAYRDGTRELREIVVDRVICAGYAGRDQEKVRGHIEELAKMGVPAPETVPTLYRVSTSLLDTDTLLECQGTQTSGEVEFVLLLQREGMLVTVGSDHTDRTLEQHDIPAAKQVCAKMIAPVAWPLEEVRDHWDGLRLTSWVDVEGEQERYQETRLASLLAPEELVSIVRERTGSAEPGTCIFSGTVPAEGGVVYSGHFSMELHDPSVERSISAGYAVEHFAGSY
ncbi:MAG: DUF2848 domain-containing protein [Synergistales bacterium]|nr:DUF2848 domain-containing protein [Synergistales bacterium]